MKRWRVVLNVVHPDKLTGEQRITEVIRYYEINLFDHTTLFSEVHKLIKQTAERYHSSLVFIDRITLSFGC